MKKFMMVICVVVSWVGISHAQNGSGTYKAAYSSDFKMADQSYADKVLTLWKDYENNTLDKHLDWFADTVSMMTADGKNVKGKAENLAGVKAYRAAIKNYKVTVEAWMSVKSVDRNQNVVCIWGDEDFTDANGKHVMQRLHEVWAFNKDGKISMILQFAGENTSM